MDLLTVFGLSFALLMIALWCYWIFLGRAKLLEKVASLREELNAASTAVPSTPKHSNEQVKPLMFSPFPPTVQIKTEVRD